MLSISERAAHCRRTCRSQARKRRFLRERPIGFNESLTRPKNQTDALPRGPATLIPAGASARMFFKRSASPEPTMTKPRISYVDPATLADSEMLAELERCRREGTPRP